MKPIFEAISIMPEKYGKGVKNKLLGNCTQKRPFYFLYYEVVRKISLSDDVVFNASVLNGGDG